MLRKFQNKTVTTFLKIHTLLQSCDNRGIVHCYKTTATRIRSYLKSGRFSAENGQIKFVW